MTNYFPYLTEYILELALKISPYTFTYVIQKIVCFFKFFTKLSSLIANFSLFLPDYFLTRRTKNLVHFYIRNINLLPNRKPLRAITAVQYIYIYIYIYNIFMYAERHLKDDDIKRFPNEGRHTF
jgi:hypothetical protein